jgi:hypothetical protein
MRTFRMRNIYREGSAWRIFLLRLAVLAVPVYLAAVLVWKYALGKSWLYSVGGYPLGMLAAGVIYCGVTSALIRRQRSSS